MLLLLSGCAHGIGIEYDSTWTQEEKLTIDAAYASWGVTDMDSHLIRVHKVAEIEGGPQVQGKTWIHPLNPNYDIEIKVPQPYLERIAGHEFGHVLQAVTQTWPDADSNGHVTSRLSIMNPDTLMETDLPTCEDLNGV